MTPSLRIRITISGSPLAMTADGKTAPVSSQRGVGLLQLSRGAEDPRRMRALRAMADAIVIGGGNAREDDADLALAAEERARRAREQIAEPMRVIVSRRGEGLSAQLRAFDGRSGGPSVLAHAAGLQLAPIVGVRFVQLGAERVEILRLLEWLAAEGCARVLVEGGAELNASFFAARAVDELYLTIVPRVLGGRGAPGVVSGEGIPNGLDASLVSVDHIGDELFLRYRFTAG